MASIPAVSMIITKIRTGDPYLFKKEPYLLQAILGSTCTYNLLPEQTPIGHILPGVLILPGLSRIACAITGTYKRCSACDDARNHASR